MRPETLVSSRQVFEGRIVDVRVDTVALPDGREATREVVGHRPACVIVPVDDDGDVLMVRQYRYAVGEALLEAPAGIVEPGESPDECALREIQEETGYAACELIDLGGFWPAPGFCDEFMHVFLAMGLTPEPLAPDEDENIEVVRHPLDRVIEMAASGEIRDGKTIAAVMLAAFCLGAVARS